MRSIANLISSAWPARPITRSKWYRCCGIAHSAPRIPRRIFSRPLLRCCHSPASAAPPTPASSASMSFLERLAALSAAPGRPFARGVFFSRGARGAIRRPARLLPQLLRRLQHAAAAGRRSAAAGKDLVHIGRVVAVALDLVIVGQLLARLNGANRFDENALAAHAAFAVRIAAVVDVARLIAVHARVDDDPRVHREQEGVVVVRVLVLVARIRLRVAQAVGEIPDGGRALADAAGGEHAGSVDAGGSHFEQGCAEAGRSLFHTAMGALMGGW